MHAPSGAAYTCTSISHALQQQTASKIIFSYRTLYVVSLLYIHRRCREQKIKKYAEEAAATYEEPDNTGWKTTFEMAQCKAYDIYSSSN